MKSTKRDLAVGILALLLSLYLLYATWPDHRTARYDCSVAEISPDIPINIKEECQTLRK
jgi:hypothetical protein